MNREIKFRAWVKKLPYHKEEYNKYTYDIQNEYDGCYDTENIEQAFVRYLNNDNYIVEQFIGLQDKNGVDVYENDNVELDMNNLGMKKATVIYRDDLMQFVFDTPKGIYTIIEDCIQVSCIEVIGNVHEEEIE